MKKKTSEFVSKKKSFENVFAIYLKIYVVTYV